MWIDTSIIFTIDPEQVVQLHIRWQDRYIRDLVRPLLRGFVRGQAALFEVDEINSENRRELEASLRETLTQELEAEGLAVQQFLIRNITFTPEYAASVEQKQVAEQQELQSQFEAQVIRNLAAGRADEAIALANARAQAVLIEAQAQADALGLIREALQSDETLLLYRYIDKISPNVRVMLLPSENPLLLSLAELDNIDRDAALEDEAQSLLPEVTVEPMPQMTPTATSSGG